MKPDDFDAALCSIEKGEAPPDMRSKVAMFYRQLYEASIRAVEKYDAGWQVKVASGNQVRWVDAEGLFIVNCEDDELGRLEDLERALGIEP